MRIVFASHNAHKREEVSRIMQNIVTEITIVGPDGDPPVEDGETFVDNALIKGRAVHRGSGHITIADDSGIVVDALGGEPGIHSARYCGTGDDEANVDLLLANLGDNPNRVAKFVCAAVVIIGDVEHVVERSWWGSIAETPRGVGGFGYDPIFIPAGFDRTSAELTGREKDMLSHRGQAFRQVALILEQHRG